MSLRPATLLARASNSTALTQRQVVLDGKRSEVVPRVASGVERERLWRAFAKVYPSLDDYLSLTDRELPVVVLEPGQA